MGKMPGQGSLPPHVVAKMISDAKALGKCAEVSTLGFVCTELAGHEGENATPHRAVDALGNVRDVWMTAPDAWTAEVSPTVNTRLLELASKGDLLYDRFNAMVDAFEHDEHLDFIQTWERVEGMIGVAMSKGLTRESAMEILSYFITRCCWSDPDTIPKRGPDFE